MLHRIPGMLQVWQPSPPTSLLALAFRIAASARCWLLGLALLWVCAEQLAGGQVLPAPVTPATVAVAAPHSAEHCTRDPQVPAAQKGEFSLECEWALPVASLAPEGTVPSRVLPLEARLRQLDASPALPPPRLRA